MSYKEGCGGCPRIPYWSNPRIMYKGEPTGTPARQRQRSFSSLPSACRSSDRAFAPNRNEPHGGLERRGRRRASAVAASAGKNDSSASSDSVISSGVPNTVVVLKKDSAPCSVVNCNGTTHPHSSCSLAAGPIVRAFGADRRQAPQQLGEHRVGARPRSGGAGERAGARATPRGWRCAAPAPRDAGSAAAR